MLTGDRSKNDALNAAFPLFQGGEYDFYFKRAPWPLGLHSTLPSSLKKKIAAALISEALGLKSVDNVSKNYLKNISYPEVDENRLDLCVRRFVSKRMETFGSLIGRLSELSDKPTNQPISEWTLSRAPFSMELLAYCGQRGALFEALAIARMMLEQIAWSYAISTSLDDNAIHKISATSSITKLKHVCSFAGKLYGWLSEHAHWDFDGHKKSVITRGKGYGHLFASTYFKAVVFCVMILFVQICFECLWTMLPSELRVTVMAEKITPHEIRAEATRWLNEILSCDPDDEDLSELASMLVE